MATDNETLLWKFFGPDALPLELYREVHVRVLVKLPLIDDQLPKVRERLLELSKSAKTLSVNYKFDRFFLNGSDVQKHKIKCMPVDLEKFELPNLTELKMSVDIAKQVRQLLKHAPNLEKLTLVFHKERTPHLVAPAVVQTAAKLRFLRSLTLNDGYLGLIRHTPTLDHPQHMLTFANLFLPSLTTLNVNCCLFRLERFADALPALEELGLACVDKMDPRDLRVPLPNLRRLSLMNISREDFLEQMFVPKESETGEKVYFDRLTLLQVSGSHPHLFCDKRPVLLDSLATELPNLTELYLGPNKADEVKKFLARPELSKLRKLTLNESSYPDNRNMSPQFCTELSQFPNNLEVLSVCSHSGRCLLEFPVAFQLPKLRHLTISNVYDTELPSMERLVALETLVLHLCSQLKSLTGFESLPMFGNLEVSYCHNLEHTFTGAKYVSGPKKDEELTVPLDFDLLRTPTEYLVNGGLLYVSALGHDSKNLVFVE